MSSKKQSVMAKNTLQELYLRNDSCRDRKPHILALLTSHMIGMEPGFSYLKKLTKKDITLRMAAEEEMLKQFPLQELVNLTGNDDWISPTAFHAQPIDQFDEIFLPILSFSLITDILSLNEKRPIVQIILKGLLKGKRITALKAGGDPFSQYWKLKGMDKGPDMLKRKLNEQMTELKMLGIRLIDFHQQAEFDVQHVKKTVITDESVRFARFSKLDQIAVPKGAIITPLARDTAKELKIEIILH
ncbi:MULTISPECIES: hypothetical protein [Cytobacillus]|uniref:Ethanolamine utilization protein n=2 Tax=Cytobacillus oceanisediminis TaxID=665099 RepID=A0A161J5F2_9BACI|nr:MULTISPECIES: hypothetical protein [Cytobacillus]AND39911.1 hypothetical protein A361_12415 [Cytobacillus oceanisediminis 2691]MCM3245772.1 hypothetical protein [Cytobacillus oceanisediminis]MCM3527511.1 hypothetical protein [Cytobacillus oceanisediminis]